MARWGIAICIGCFALVAHAGEPRLTMEGLGPARIGMTRAALAKALGVPLVTGVEADDPDGCVEVQAGKREGVGYMLIGGRLARIDVHAPPVETRSGVRVGMAEGDVLRTYGAGVSRSPHFYGDADDHYLTLHSKDGALGMRFETEGGKVTRYYAGTAESIEYVEGCL